MEAAGPNYSVQYNLGGVLTGDTNLQWNPTAQTLTIVGEIINAGYSTNRVLASLAGQIVALNAITAFRALMSDTNGLPVASGTSQTELEYLMGVTSNVQTQLNSKGSTSDIASLNASVASINLALASINLTLLGKQDTITILGVDKGGTNSGTVLVNNRVIRSIGNAIKEAAAITAARALISDADGIPTHSPTTAAQLEYLSTKIPTGVGGTNNDSVLAGNRIIVSTTTPELAMVELAAIAPNKRLITDTNGLPTAWDIQNVMVLDEDWLSATSLGALGWTAINNGAGSPETIVSTAQTATWGFVGTLRVPTGTAIAGRCTVYLSLDAIVFGLGGNSYDFLCRIGTDTALSDGTNPYTHRFGFIDNTGAGDMVNGLYFEYDHTQSANWRICTSQSSVRTKTNTSVPVAVDTAYYFGISIDTLGTLVTYSINGATVGTIATNIPLGFGGRTGIGFKTEKGGAGNLSRAQYVDQMQLTRFV